MVKPDGQFLGFVEAHIDLLVLADCIVDVAQAEERVDIIADDLLQRFDPFSKLHGPLKMGTGFLKGAPIEGLISDLQA